MGERIESNLKISWKPHLLSAMKRCYDKGLSALETCNLLNREYGETLPYGLNFTRNCVIGKWHRMGLKRGRAVKLNCINTSGMGNGGMALRRVHKTRGFGLVQNDKVHAPKVGRGVFKDNKIDDYDLGTLRIAFADIEAKSCRWAYGARGTYSFCGAEKVQGRSYCEAHLKRAYQPKKVRPDGQEV